MLAPPAPVTRSPCHLLCGSLMPVQLPWRPETPANPKCPVCAGFIGDSGNTLTREHRRSFLCSGRYQFLFRLQRTYWETCISNFLSLFAHDISKCADPPTWLFLALSQRMPLLLPGTGAGTVFPGSHLDYSFHTEFFSLPLPSLARQGQATSWPPLIWRGKVWGASRQRYPLSPKP